MRGTVTLACRTGLVGELKKRPPHAHTQPVPVKKKKRRRKKEKQERHALQSRSCVKVEVAVLGSPSLIVLMVSVDAKQH